MTGRVVHLPDLRTPPAPATASGWYVISSDPVVSVPSLGDARACAGVATSFDVCERRVLAFDPPRDTAIVAIGSGTLIIEAELRPTVPEDETPVLVVTGPAPTAHLSGVALGPCRTHFAFAWDASAAPPGNYELTVEGYEGLPGAFHLGPASSSAGFDPCALALEQISERVGVAIPDPPAEFPLPPLVSITPEGCILEAWFSDAQGRSVIPRAENRVDVFADGCVGLLASITVDGAIRDGIVWHDRVAVLLADQVLLFDLSGCVATPSAITGLVDAVGLAVSDSGALIVVQRGLGVAPRDHQVLLFRADGSQVETPAGFGGRGWFARHRNPGIVFDGTSCAYLADPSRITEGCCAEAARPLTENESFYFRLLDDLSELRRRVAFPEQGSLIIGPTREGDPLDAVRPGTQWHRVLLFGDIPDGCAIQVETRSFDNVLEGDPLISTGWSIPVRATSNSQVPVSSPGDTRIAAADVAVLARPGRYVWMRITLLSNGVATPRITSIEVEHPRIGIARFLPAVFPASTAEDDFLRRWLSIFEDTAFDGVAERMDAYAELFDPRYAPPEMLPFLAAWLEVLDLARLRNDTDEFRRALIHADDLARTRGTIAGLLLAIRLYLGFDVQIVESYKKRSGFVLGAGSSDLGVKGPALGCQTILSNEPSPLWLGDQPLLGCGFLLDCESRTGTIPYEFEVLVPARFLCSTEDQRLMRLVLDTEKPAHTSYRIRATAPAGFVVGVASTVGQDISSSFNRDDMEPSTFGLLLGNGPARPKPIGRGFALGRDSRLSSGERPPGLVVGGLPSAGFRLGA